MYFCVHVFFRLHHIQMAVGAKLTRNSKLSLSSLAQVLPGDTAKLVPGAIQPEDGVARGRLAPRVDRCYLEVRLLEVVNDLSFKCIYTEKTALHEVGKSIDDDPVVQTQAVVKLTCWCVDCDVTNISLSRKNVDTNESVVLTPEHDNGNGTNQIFDTSDDTVVYRRVVTSSEANLTAYVRQPSDRVTYVCNVFGPSGSIAKELPVMGDRRPTTVTFPFKATARFESVIGSDNPTTYKTTTYVFLAVCIALAGVVIVGLSKFNAFRKCRISRRNFHAVPDNELALTSHL